MGRERTAGEDVEFVWLRLLPTLAEPAWGMIGARVLIVRTAAANAQADHPAVQEADS